MKKNKIISVMLSITMISSGPVFAADISGMSRDMNIDTSSFNMGNMGSMDTSSLGNIDTSSFGNIDTSSFGNIDTSSFGNIDTSAFGDIDTSSFGDIDTSSFGSLDTSKTKDLDKSSMGSLDTGSLDTDIETPSVSDGEAELNGDSLGSLKETEKSNPLSMNGDDIKSAFDKTSISLNNDGSLSIDVNDENLMGNFKDIASAMGVGEMKQLEMPSLDTLEGEMSEDMKSKADFTLKSFMGTQYDDLSSNIFTIDKAKSVDIESLNVKYADLLEGMNIKDDYTLNTSQIEKAKEGYSTSAVDLFNSSFGNLNLKDGPKNYSVPKSFDPKKMLNSNLQKRNKAVEPPKDSAIYQAVAKRMSLGDVVNKKKAKSKSKKK